MNWLEKVKTFIAEVRSEMKKVTFPSRDEVISTTIVVLVTSLIFALYLYLSDLVIIWGYQSIVKVLSG